MPGLETDRSQLRMFTMDDLDELSPIFADPEVVRHLGSGKPAPRSETETALRSIITHWERHGFGRWAVLDKGTRKLIGYGGLRSFDGEPELVYLLAKPYWGRGLATEIARACLKYGFEDRGFERIIGMAKTANVASQRVLDKTGMCFERSANLYGMDVICYAITRATYQAQRPADDRVLKDWWCPRQDLNLRPHA
jgi:RimJ/RimL family protein N-acetyltransferase